ncbi:MAG: hypothetical protein HY898_31160 [Deltaproteobacteria bacterium]|nr:hypothetical protein [Deltaproteobacteria bacterium]
MERDILGYKCRKCGHVQYPYRTRCRGCGHVEWNGVDIVYDTVPLPKNGKLLTFTHLYALPSDFEAVNISLGIVELEGGNRITGQLKIKDPKIGMKVFGKVEVVRREEYKKYWGMVFYAEGA